MYLQLWSRENEKIKILQTELNSLFPNDNPKLKIDGVFGQITRSWVKKYQRQNGKLFVDGIFGPKTFAQFKLKVPNTKLTTRATATIPNAQQNKLTQVAHHAEIKKVFDKKGKDKDWNLFIKAIEDGSIPEMKKVLLTIQNADTARGLAKIFIAFRKWGFTGKEMRVAFSQFMKLNEKDLAKVLNSISKPSGAFGRIMSSAGAIATKIGLVVTVIECIIFAKRGNYAAIFGELYKFIMGKCIPWAGMIDALQSLIELVVPKSWQLNAVFKILKVANPIGLGAVGIESMAAWATATFHVIKNGGEIGAAIPRLDKLVKRLKKSPASGLAELGENAGDSAYQLYRMSATEWALIMSYRWRQFKGLIAGN